MNEENKEQNKIKELEEKIAELENSWKRALADYKNLERRTIEDRETFLNFSNEALIRSLLPILDHLEMLTTHLSDEGLNMIVKDFKHLLSIEGVEEIETTDKEFDPETMDAIETVEGDPNKVIEVITKGYYLKSKLLRPARVKVGQKNLGGK
jgi:molecular chaperone GrpE